MAKGIEGHSDSAPKPGFGKGSFEGVGTYGPDPGLEMEKGTFSGNCGREPSGVHTTEKMEWPGDKEFEHGDDGDKDKDK